MSCPSVTAVEPLPLPPRRNPISAPPPNAAGREGLAVGDGASVSTGVKCCTLADGGVHPHTAISQH